MNQQQLQSRSPSSQRSAFTSVHSGSQSSLALLLLQSKSTFKAKPITIEGLSVVKWPERCCVKTVKVNKR